jgi:hypothetical protein
MCVRVHEYHGVSGTIDVGQSNDDQMERGAVLTTKSSWNPLVGLSAETCRIPHPIRFGWMIDQ